MKDFKILLLLDRLRWLFAKFGIDYPIMRKILQVKLLMDSRKAPAIIGQRNKKKQRNDSNQFIQSLWIYLIMGCFMIILIVFGDHFLFQMSLYFGVLMFMVMMSVVSDFSTVLLDTRDKGIILTKPVNSRTLGLAKAIHVTIYMFYLTIAFSGPALIVSLFKHGFLFFILFIIELIFVNILIVVLTALLYMFVLRFFDGEKLKDVINYFQIMLSLGMAIGYQVLIRVFEFVDLEIVFNLSWWHYLIIPIWYGAAFEYVMNGMDRMYLILTLFSIAVPILAIFYYLKLLPTFEHNLQKLSSVQIPKRKSTKSLFSWGGKWICQSREERIFYQFAHTMMKNEREFKLKVYPILGMSIVIPFIILFSFLRESNLSEITANNSYIIIYFSGLMIPTLVMMVQHSSTYKGAWIYKVAPLGDLSALKTGTLKAVLMNYVVPTMLFEGVLFTILYGVRIIPDLFAVLLAFSFLTVLCFQLFTPSLPFSEPMDTVQQSQGVKTFLSLILIVLLMGVHYLSIRLWDYGVYMYLIVLFFVNALMWRKIN
ncbi:hypothetical protein ACIQD3_17895 [Peribacillus loiseleuriae]|uniref:hypothetical protein n=1 Tax=Peribacillus loiseleuriae TaxID=1679170 RepID=UPI0037FF2C99